MSLDPRDHRRRGRSKSPGRKREDERSHSKVRPPSPPAQTSKYAYDNEPPARGKTYDYDDRERERSARDTVDAQPRAYYDPRGSDPRVAPVDPYAYAQGGRPEYGAPTGGYPSTSRPEYAAPALKQEYSMPGAFDSEEPAPPLPARYPAATTTTAGSRGKEKDYYKDLAYGEKPYEKDYHKDLAYGEKPYEKAYAKPEQKSYGRATSPLPPSKKEKNRYEDVSPPRKDKGRGRYEDVSPPRKSANKYQDSDSDSDSEDEPPKKSKSRYEEDEPPKKSKPRYEDVSPPPRSSRYEDEDPRRSKTKFVDDDPRKSRSKYEDPSPKSSQYQDLDKYKYDRADPKYNDAKRYEEDRYRQGKYDKEDKYEKEDKYGKPVDKYEKDGRDRGASFNIAAGQHNFSAGVNLSSRQDEKSQYVRPPSPSDFAPPGALGNPTGYADLKKYEYAQTDPTAKSYTKSGDVTGKIYNARPASPPYSANPYTADPRSRHESNPNYQPESARSSQSKIVTVGPGARSNLDAPGAYRRDPSPAPGLNRGLHSLSVSTGHHGGASMSLATAPGSPLLESYHGTYQSISPMPSPLMIAQTAHSDALVLQALDPDSSSSDEDDRRGKKKRNARFHDPEEEAVTLAQALKGDRRGPDIEPLIEILPALSHEQILELRVEYKKIVKTGPDKKGVNIAKHIKSRMKEEDPSLMKACYACALGKWESEAYWANFWYQGEKSRRELLIESLMGRTNREIQQIKDGFADKKYGDSLTKCMKTELREDKFKKAVLLVLDEKKMEERPGYALDRDLIEDDVRNLYRAVRAEKGGETAMINIIVVRSDAHLREVLKVYESIYRANFAREMLKKSGNLVVSHLLSLFYDTFANALRRVNF